MKDKIITKVSNEEQKPCLRQLAVSACPFVPFVAVGCTPVNPSFHADTYYWYSSQGLVGINNVIFIQKTSPNE